MRSKFRIGRRQAFFSQSFFFNLNKKKTLWDLCMISKTFSIQETSHHLTRKISIRRGWKSRLASIRVTSGNEYRELPRQDVRDWKIWQETNWALTIINTWTWCLFVSGSVSIYSQSGNKQPWIP
jgi:hypothetical protein